MSGLVFPDVPCSNCLRISGDLPWSVVLETEHMFAFVHPRPRSRGALVVTPRRHMRAILELSAEEVAAAAEVLFVLTHCLNVQFEPDGLHSFCNNGVVAGQSEPHLHWQLVPRYSDASYSYGPSEEIAEAAEHEIVEVQSLIVAELSKVGTGPVPGV